MAGRTMEIVAALALVTMLAAQTAAQNGCTSMMISLSPCLDFISSKVPAPSSSCCTSLAGVVQSDPRCLCMVLNGGTASFGLSINKTRALELPGVCKVQTPPISQCSGVPTPPTTPPAPTPAMPPATGSAAASDAPSASTESDTTASSTNHTSDGYSKNAASFMATVLLAACALLSVF